MKKIGVFIVAFFLAAGGLFILLHGSEKDDAPELLRESDGVSSTAERVSSSMASVVADARSVVASFLGPPFHADTSQPAASVSADARADAKQEQAADVFEAAASGDPAQLEFVYTQLSNAQPEIREEALDAIIQFAGRKAIPRLKQIADATGSVDEKTSILEAIEFLELPSMSEKPSLRASARQNKAAISNVHPRRKSKP
jgi:hypothetical protein